MFSLDSSMFEFDPKDCKRELEDVGDDPAEVKKFLVEKIADSVEERDKAAEEEARYKKEKDSIEDPEEKQEAKDTWRACQKLAIFHERRREWFQLRLDEMNDTEAARLGKLKLDPIK
eukprot:gnl/MRDRNA2_/MRDRNA2_107780_c0_seq1.p1 gnl/MRDRNA2_/MRDRNA2_107780_c0~~gnl/MRDRNA2_/MRDRNA2_107780_c0_seq1.p1  ORF type:complete len:117 (+),score=40.59 gnl/MRDRNA2_/MRDRNA2_107780_c0_seq1:63-413(+)